MNSENAKHEDKVPYPRLTSHFHRRIAVPTESVEEKLKRWSQQPVLERALDAVLSRIMVRGKLLKPSTKRIPYFCIQKFFKIIFKVCNRMKVYGLENIPKSGCIFLPTHPGQLDPLLLMTSVNFQIGMFVAWGNGWFMDMIEQMYGIMSLRRWGLNVAVERMIRLILTKNKYFAIWPEGHPKYNQLVEEGHSSIVRVYTTINIDKDRIPFVPVLLRGAEMYHVSGEDRNRTKRPHRTFLPIEVHFLKPIFLDRTWLKPPEQGGKTPREMIDFVMHMIARKQGQKELAPNRVLEWKRKWYALQKEGKTIGWS